MGLLNRIIKKESKKGTCLFVDKISKYIPNIEELLNEGIDIDKINELERISGNKMPQEFTNLYLRYNGENQNAFGLMAGFRWMDIDSIIRVWNSLQKSAYEIISDKEGLVKEGHFRKGWIPFAEDCGGSFLVIDLEPDSGGEYGQVITIDRESDISYVIAESFEKFLEFIESSFKDKYLNIIQDEEIQIIQWKTGHLFDDIIFLTGIKIEEKTFPIDRFWVEYFKDDVKNGYISAEKLAKRRSVFITADMGKKFGQISLNILRHMINLNELIIHADEINSFKPINEVKSLKKLVIGSKSFKESDLQFLINLEKLRELALVKLTLNDLSILKNMKALKCLRLYKVNNLNSDSIGFLKSLTELSLEDIETGNLSYISKLDKLTKLELKKISMPNLEFLNGSKKLTKFDTDKKAKDESNIKVFQEMPKLKELIYPIGDIQSVANFGSELPKLGPLRYSDFKKGKV